MQPRDAQNRLFYSDSVSVRFLKKNLIQFRMSLIRFGLKLRLQFGYYIVTAKLNETNLSIC